MEAEWKSFESEILRDITDSQFAFQVTLERIEVRTTVLLLYCADVCVRVLYLVVCLPYRVICFIVLIYGGYSILWW
jgi:hypothetical protein